MADRKTRICYVINSFAIGGAETVVLDLARGHDRRYFDVEVVAALEPPCAVEPEMRRRFREAGIETTAIYQGSFRSPLALWRLFRFFQRRKFDIVHGHNRGSDYWAVRLGGLAGVPHRFWTRHLVYLDMTARQLGKYQSVSGKVDKVFAVSETVRLACIEREGIPGDKVATVANGIDPEKFRPLSCGDRDEKLKELGHPATEKMLLFVGRFNAQKAPEAFVRLIWILRRNGLPVRGYMCGQGPLEADLARLVADGPGGVEILGLRSDIPALLATCDVFVSTSRNEGLPLNVMEAMSCAAGFVAPDIPQIGELVKGDPLLEGQLVASPPLTGEVPDSLLESWAARVKDSLADEDGLRAVGQAGREMILKDFSLDRMVREYERHFRLAMKTPAPLP